MRLRIATWYECKIRYDKIFEIGESKKVTNIYVVDALSFTEAESQITKDVTGVLTGEFELKGLKEAAYREIIFSDSAEDNIWFKIKLCFISYDEKNGKEKKSSTLYLVQANSIKNAMRNIEETMKTSVTDYSIQSITQTNIEDVFINTKI